MTERKLDPMTRRLYDAEQWVLDVAVVETLTAARQLVTEITTTTEWAELAGGKPTPRVITRHFRSGFYVGRANRRTHTVSLASNARPWSDRLVLHELAHLAAPCGGHGLQFQATYLRMLEVSTNPWAAAAGYEPGREQRERLLVGLVREGLHPGPVPLDLVPALSPGLDHEGVEIIFTQAFFRRAAARRGVTVPCVAAGAIA